MRYPDGAGARREREPDKECAAPTDIGDGAKISLQRCDASTSRVAFVDHDILAVNPDVAERLAGNVIWFPHRASISQKAGHRLLATRYLRQQPDTAADRS